MFTVVAASTRWFGVRASVLCSVLITVVAFVSVLLSQNAGKVALDVLSFVKALLGLAFFLSVILGKGLTIRV